MVKGSANKTKLEYHVPRSQGDALLEDGIDELPGELIHLGRDVMLVDGRGGDTPRLK